MGNDPKGLERQEKGEWLQAHTGIWGINPSLGWNSQRIRGCSIPGSKLEKPGVVDCYSPMEWDEFSVFFYPKPLWNSIFSRISPHKRELRDWSHDYFLFYWVKLPQLLRKNPKKSQFFPPKIKTATNQEHSGWWKCFLIPNSCGDLGRFAGKFAFFVILIDHFWFSSRLSQHFTTQGAVAQCFFDLLSQCFGGIFWGKILKICPKFQMRRAGHKTQVQIGIFQVYFKLKGRNLNETPQGLMRTKLINLSVTSWLHQCLFKSSPSGLF